MMRLRRWVKLTIALIIVAIAGLLATMIMDFRRSAAIEPIESALKQDLGFDYGTPYQDGKEVFRIKEVDPEGPMAKAGIRSGDVLRSYHDTRDLFEDLERSRGASLTIQIERGGKTMTMVVNVPARQPQSDNP